MKLYCCNTENKEKNGSYFCWKIYREEGGGLDFIFIGGDEVTQVNFQVSLEKSVGNRPFASEWLNFLNFIFNFWRAP